MPFKGQMSPRVKWFAEVSTHAIRISNLSSTETLEFKNKYPERFYGTFHIIGAAIFFFWMHLLLLLLLGPHLLIFRAGKQVLHAGEICHSSAALIAN